MEIGKRKPYILEFRQGVEPGVGKCELVYFSPDIGHHLVISAEWENVLLAQVVFIKFPHAFSQKPLVVQIFLFVIRGTVFARQFVYQIQNPFLFT